MKPTKPCVNLFVTMVLLLSLFSYKPGQASTSGDSWRIVASMPTARTLLGVATATNGKIYAIGGKNNSNELGTVEEYDPATNTWTTKANMPTPRQNLSVTAASNGKVYAIGGEIHHDPASAFNTVEEYDPATNTWTTKANMPTPRGWFGSAYSNGKIYAIGGMNSTGSLSTVEAYDPATNTWTTCASMPTARWPVGVAATSNGKIYAIGGDGYSTVEEYDPVTDTWTKKSDMLIPRWNIGVASLNGKVYVVGGQWLGPALAEYDPVTDTWTMKANMLLGERICSGVAVANGKIYAVGGHNTEVVGTVEEYTPGEITESYSISGQVSISGTNNGLSGVTVSAGTGYSALTNENGYYTISTVPAGNYTLIPSKSGYTFTPSTINVLVGPNASGKNFVGAANESIPVKAVSGFNSIHVSWEPVNYATVTGYRVQRASPTAQDNYTVITTTANLYHFDAAGLAQDRNYCYKVEALASGSVVASSSPVCAIFGQTNLWIPDIFGIPGDANVIIPINIRNATGLQIASADLWLEYDPDVLTCIDVANTPMSVEFQWEFNCSTPGLVKISTFASPPKAVMGDGSLFWLTFNVIGQAGTTSALTLKPFVSAVGGSSIYSDPGDGMPVEVPLILNSGTFYVESTGKLGDVTNDGTVNSADAYLALQISVDKVVPTSKQKYAADVNGDGVSNSADVPMILYYAAHAAWPIPPSNGSAYLQVTQSATPVAKVTLDNVSGNSGSTVAITLRGKNLQNWAGGDFIITLDPRLVAKVVGVTSTGLANASPLQYQYSSDGSLKISIGRSASINGTGVLATITLQMLQSSIVHTSPLVLAGVRFHDPYGRDFELSAIQGTIERQNGSIVIVENKVYLAAVMN